MYKIIILNLINVFIEEHEYKLKVDCYIMIKLFRIRNKFLKGFMKEDMLIMK